MHGSDAGRVRRTATPTRPARGWPGGYLRALLSPAVATAGWPGSLQYRFEGRGVQVLLWSQHGQCDWWISAASEESLRAFAAGLLELPGLRGTLGSNDDAGTRLLGELFDESRR